MTQRYSDESSSRQSSREGWTGLMTSMITFTNAAAMFGLQQLQNAMTIFTDSRRGLDRYKHAFDSLSDAMEGEMDDSYRSTTENLNRVGARAMGASGESRTWDREKMSHRQSRTESYRGAEPSSSEAEALAGRKR
jgi:hypothetical protein